MPDTPEANRLDQALLNVVVAQRDAALNEAARQTARAIVAEAERDALKQGLTPPPLNSGASVITEGP